MTTARDEAVLAGAWVAGPSDLMSILGIDRREVANCRVVRWLLDPLSQHGIGSELMRRLAEKVDVAPPTVPHVRVSVEVVRLTSRADVVCEGLPEGPIVIEAKIDAVESETQGGRLEEDWPQASALVFLTVHGARLPSTANDSSRWSPLSWRWIADTTVELLQARSSDGVAERDEARMAARAWADSVRRNLL